MKINFYRPSKRIGAFTMAVIMAGTITAHGFTTKKNYSNYKEIPVYSTDKHGKQYVFGYQEQLGQTTPIKTGEIRPDAILPSNNFNPYYLKKGNIDETNNKKRVKNRKK